MVNREDRKITITLLGSGGCGSNIVCTTAKYLTQKRKQESDLYRFSWYLHDLSIDVVEAARRLGKGMADSSPVFITPAALDPGAGRVPLCAEIAWECMPRDRGEAQTIGSEDSKSPGSDSGQTETAKEASNFGVVYRSSINVYVSSLGGGTGGATISALIPSMKERFGGIVDFAISVLTEVAGEDLNEIYNFPRVNEAADFVIVLENGALIGEKRADRNMINRKAAEIVDLLISSRISDPDTTPGPMDFTNIVNSLAGSANYNTRKARWLVPFLFPGIEDVDTTLYKKKQLVELVEEALRCGRLCKVVPEDVTKSEACLLIVKAPRQYIQEFEQEIIKVEPPLSRRDAFVQALAGRLCLDPSVVSYVLVPDEAGFKLGLFLLNMPLPNLRELKKIIADPRPLERMIRGWKHGVGRGVETFDKLIKDSGKVPTEVLEKYIKKIELKKITDPFVTRYGDLLNDLTTKRSD